MRIPIREQLGAIVLLSTLIGLAVVTVATWIVNYDFVLDIRSSGLSLTASLKATQLSSNLQLLQSSVKALSTRVRLQTALERYYEGNNTYENWVSAREDFQGALQDSAVTLTATVVHNNYTLAENKTTLLNVTNAAIGEGFLFPPQLDPNITYGSQPINATFNRTLALYKNHELNNNSSILLGPYFINDTTSLLSLTTPVMNTTTFEILGWITVQLTTSLVYEVIRSPEGLEKTGTVLLIGPEAIDNRLAGSMWLERLPATRNTSSLGLTKVRYVFPPIDSEEEGRRHYVNEPFQPFQLSQYSAAYEAFSTNLGTINNAGSNIATYNEDGYQVSVGFAIPQTSLAAWLLIVEQARDEVWEPIRHLRVVLLGCVFGTAGVMLLLIWPAAHFASLPIRRLRDATKQSIEPHTGSDDSPSGSPVPPKRSDRKHNHIDATEKAYSSSPEPDHDSGLAANGKPKDWPWKSYFARRGRGTAQGAVPDEETVGKYFKIPGRVKDGKHIVRDELTDLTTTFNEMSDELVMQYAKLEERVRSRTAELELSKRAAEAANESKTLFIANISHELKTPLNGILGMCAVSMQEDDDTKIKKSLGLIYKSGDLLHNLLTDLLTFSKNQVGQNLSLDQREFDIHDIGSQLKAIFNNQTKESNVNFSIEYAGPCDSLGNYKFDDQNASGTWNDDPKRFVYAPNSFGKVRNMTLWGDQHRILQVAINLVSNGLKFTPAEGKVKLTIRCLTISEDPPSRRSSLQSVSKQSVRSSRNRTRRESPSQRSSSFHERSMATATAINPLERRSRVSHTNLSSRDPSPPMKGATTWFDFEVEDTGPGIPEHLQEQIFEPFVQGDLRLTKKFGGTGLGLSICSQLAALMNGHISLESEVGAGSKFTLRIPLKLVGSRSDAESAFTASRANSVSEDAIVVAPKDGSPESPPDDMEEATRHPSIPFESSDAKPRLIGLSQPYFSKANPPMASPNAAKKENKIRVLVAEDNKVNQEVVLRMLRLEDVFDVHVARDGQEALDMVKQTMEIDQPYHLIFMDVQMPNLDGRESTRKIREIGYSAPIVALTAFADEINQKECMDSGMDYFLAKPIRRPALKHVLNTYCPTIDEVEEGEGGVGNPNPFDVISRGEAATRLDEVERTEHDASSATPGDGAGSPRELDTT